MKVQSYGICRQVSPASFHFHFHKHNEVQSVPSCSQYGPSWGFVPSKDEEPQRRACDTDRLSEAENFRRCPGFEAHLKPASTAAEWKTLFDPALNNLNWHATANTWDVEWRVSISIIGHFESLGTEMSEQAMASNQTSTVWSRTGSRMLALSSALPAMISGLPNAFKDPWKLEEGGGDGRKDEKTFFMVSTSKYADNLRRTKLALLSPTGNSRKSIVLALLRFFLYTWHYISSILDTGSS
jgi:hypothetical protein